MVMSAKDLAKARQMTSEEYQKLSPTKMIDALIGAMEESAEHAGSNVLLSGWPQDTFWGTADRLRELKKALKNGKQ